MNTIFPRTTSPSKTRARRQTVAPAQILFDDAVAIVDQQLGVVTWVSQAWREAQPGLDTGASIADVTSMLPEAGLSGQTPPLDAEPARWHVQSQRLTDHTLALRLTDRRAQGRALQRQLNDRESLLFTSRVLSVGEMATTLAHELNQPIAAAANLLRGLKSRLARRPDALTDDESKALSRSLDQIMFAAQVITRIRDFTHSHRPDTKPIDLAELVTSSAALLDWDMQQAGIEMSIVGADLSIQVHGDAVMLQQVLINLMRNAADALRSDPPATPKLSLQIRERGKQAEVQVSDNGCGLDDASAEKLFVPFASSKPNGMGLGLSICRSFIEHHQGRLWFSRNPVRGTNFHIALPLLAAEHPTN